ncbi:MAG: molecular chaperone DnaK [Acidobacteria bacterium]|nr:molecular chaperone DnaK [Acidobacteriota bacterium]
MRSFIGIDLGTTNSALAYIRASETEDAEFPPVHVLDIPQPVAEGIVEARRTLPSFLLTGDTPQVGVHAREQGALTPTRLVHSAKSWLSNPAVDRTAKILPWDAGEGGRLFSPVEASTAYIAAMREAWERAGNEPFGGNEVVLTVPASFDEEARELTVAAAQAAGVAKLTLLEEPAAAFYSWIANHLAQSRKDLFDGQIVLVIDVGGGTSDFTLIKVHRDGDRIDFTRTAVGRHLLLGGDNLDLTLSWLAESKLNAQLSVRQKTALRRQCAAAKERMLADATVDRVPITILGAGRSLIGGTLRTEITREEALELALDGFLSSCAATDRPQREEMSPFGELGLPYENDPAITRHLAAFLADSGNAVPDAVLFNGGFFIPDLLRNRTADVLESWFGKRPLILENRGLDLAVAVGAAYYSYVRTTGAGLVVRGGLPRSYYVELDSKDGALNTVTIMPRGTQEGETLHIEQEGLQLVANKPVTFRLYSSLTRLDDPIGSLVSFPKSDVEEGVLHRHAPLNAVIRFGKPGERTVPVRLGAKLTEVGTLELWAESKISEHRWRLQFELRKQANADAPARPAAVIPDEALTAAESLIRDTFERFTIEPEALPARLEQTLALGRNSWPLSAIRRMADLFLSLAESRKRGAALEARWLNLCGLCLRPGFGFPGDEYRIEIARRMFASGIAFPNAVQNESEWWIFWGRVAGGLNRNQQADIYQRIAGSIMPRKNQKVRVNSSLLREMWRCACSLELLPAHTRTELGDALVKRIHAGDFRESELWCLGRLGARNLFHGPSNQVLPAATAARWVDALAKVLPAAETLAALARRTGDAYRDLPPASIGVARRVIEQHKDAARLLPVLEGASTRDSETLSRIFGEELPSGLVIE